ncbi:LysE family transporter [Paraferrimonas sp. SM1919]|uniref:LysE family transporter n=1 Tax=Paraferrimonas sp. SM1919 TaxID=2662263 RepID=UPI0013D6E0A3|nr:LysE family transporter [Paraferrimonas sp. SM1919]
MELLQGLILIGSIHLLAAASPGPDFVLVTQQTLVNGRRTGLLCALGIALGLSVHILYSAFGLAAIIANSELALNLIKILGGGYLLYLGSLGLRSQPQAATAATLPQPQQLSSLATISKGFLCNAFNPKAPIYFVSLFTVVISPELPIYQVAIYGGWIMLIQLLWFSTVVLLLSHPAVLSRFQSHSHWVDRVMGLAMGLLGLHIWSTFIF